MVPREALDAADLDEGADDARRLVAREHRRQRIEPTCGTTGVVPLQHIERIDTRSFAVDVVPAPVAVTGWIIEPAATLHALGEVSERPKERDWKSRTC